MEVENKNERNIRNSQSGKLRGRDFLRLNKHARCVSGRRWRNNFASFCTEELRSGADDGAGPVIREFLENYPSNGSRGKSLDVLTGPATPGQHRQVLRERITRHVLHENVQKKNPRRPRPYFRPRHTGILGREKSLGAAFPSSKFENHRRGGSCSSRLVNTCQSPGSGDALGIFAITIDE